MDLLIPRPAAARFADRALKEYLFPMKRRVGLAIAVLCGAFAAPGALSDNRITGTRSSNIRRTGNAAAGNR
jgi:hypothetical protein